MTTVVMRKLFDGKRDEVSDATALRFLDDKGKPLAMQFVKQSELEGTKIDNILARYAQAGLNPFIDPVQAGQVYGYKITHDEYMESAAIVSAAKSQFEMLGAEVRERFQNSVERYLEFAADPANELELAALVSRGTKVDRKGHVVGEKGERVDFEALKAELNRPQDPTLVKIVDQGAPAKPAQAGVPV